LNCEYFYLNFVNGFLNLIIHKGFFETLDSFKNSGTPHIMIHSRNDSPTHLLEEKIKLLNSLGLNLTEEQKIALLKKEKFNILLEEKIKMLNSLNLSEEEKKVVDNIEKLCSKSRICAYKKKYEHSIKIESEQIATIRSEIAGEHAYAVTMSTIFRTIKKYNDRRDKVLKILTDKYGKDPHIHSIILEEFAYTFPMKQIKRDKYGIYV